MLNGIGGRTIEEAQRSLSYTEVARWIRFRQKRGTLHLGRRLDRNFAQISVRLANRYRDTKQKPEPFTIWDFLPYEEEPAITLDEAMKLWSDDNEY